MMKDLWIVLLSVIALYELIAKFLPKGYLKILDPKTKELDPTPPDAGHALREEIRRVISVQEGK